MSINTMKLALEALENASPAAWASRVDSDTMKSIWRKHAEALEGLQVLLAELDNASCKSAQKRLEAQQPATGVPDDVVRDAERYRWLRKWKGQEHEPPFTVQHEFDGTIWGGDLDSAIDAAMHTATQAQKGQP